jgi:hypothetical protein
VNAGVCEAYPEFRVVHDRLFVVLFFVVGEVVHRDTVVLDILHDLRIGQESAEIHKHSMRLNYPLLEVPQFGHGQRIRLANHRDNIDARGKPSHEFDVDFSKAMERDVSPRWNAKRLVCLRMSCWRDKVEARVDPEVLETRVT